MLPDSGGVWGKISGNSIGRNYYIKVVYEEDNPIIFYGYPYY